MPVGKANSKTEVNYKEAGKMIGKISTPDPFEFIEMAPTHREGLLISIEGETSTRKTGFCLSAPDPIDVMEFDNRFYDVMNIYLEMGKRIRAVIDPLIMRPPLECGIGYDEQAQNIWASSEVTYYGSLANSISKSVVVDTGSHWWEMVRWAYHGKLTQVMPKDYDKVNQVFRTLLQQARRSGKIVIFTHRVKDEWVGNNSTGKKVMQGYNGINYDCDLILVTSMVGGKQHITVRKDGVKQAKEGHIYRGAEECNFAYIASDITGTPIDDWR